MAKFLLENFMWYYDISPQIICLNQRKLHSEKQLQIIQSLSRIWLFVTCGLQHNRLPCPTPTPVAYSNSCPLCQWCHSTISSSVVPFSSCLQSFPASGSFQMSRFFASGGQSIGASASASVLPMNIQRWFPLGLTGWISLQSKGLSRVFSNTTVQNSYLLYGEKINTMWCDSQIKNVSLFNSSKNAQNDSNV